MLRLHGMMSICLGLAILAGGTARAQDTSIDSRLLRSAPSTRTYTITKDATAKEQTDERATTRTRQLPTYTQRQTQPTRTSSNDDRTTVPVQRGTRVRVNRQPTESTEQADSQRQNTRQNFNQVLERLGAAAPYDLSGSRRYLVAAEKNGRGLMLCDLSNGRRLRLLESSNRRYALVEISSDARWIAGVRRDDSDRVDVWRADNGRLIGTLDAAGGAKGKLEFSEKGDQLSVIARDGNGQVFAIPSGKLVGGIGYQTGSGRAAVKTPRIEAAPPQLSPRVSAAPGRPAAPQETAMPEPASASPPPITKQYAVPKAAGPEPTIAAPAQQSPPRSFRDEAPAAPTTTAQPPQTTAAPRIATPETAAPRMAAPKMAAPKMAAPAAPEEAVPTSAPIESPVAAPAEPEPRMAAPEPRMAAPEPRMAAPQPRAMMRESDARDESDAGAEPPAAAAPGVFDTIGSALPETAIADEPSVPEGGAFSGAGGGGASMARSEPTPAEPAGPAAPGNSGIDPSTVPPPEGTAAAPPPPEEDRSSVTVHFATNRNRLAEADRAWSVYFKGFFSTLPAFIIYALVVLAALVFPWFGKRTWAGYAVATGLVLLCSMAGLEAYVRSQLRDELTGELYGSRPVELSYGACEISVPLPQNRQAGEVNRPVSVWVFEAPENPEKHFMLRKVTEHENQEAFFASLSNQFAKQGTKAALLFIHGYNVSFEDAIFRTAQLAVDLKFQGAPITFSWPSYADPVKYTFDEQNAEVSIPAFRQFLADLAAKSGAERVHVIAHSMGNRVLAGAMETMSPAAREQNKQVFREVVLAAPDVDRRVFESQVLPHIGENAQHCTLYASSRDRALLISRYFHNFQRLGETEPELIVCNGMDTIDASLVDTSLLGHSYIGDAQSIVSDLHELVVSGKRPMERLGLQTLQRAGLPYWTINPQLEMATGTARQR